MTQVLPLRRIFYDFKVLLRRLAFDRYTAGEYLIGPLLLFVQALAPNYAEATTAEDLLGS